MWYRFDSESLPSYYRTGCHCRATGAEEIHTESAGTLKTDTLTFGVMTFVVIFIIAALSFFPVHALSTIAEHLSL